MKSLNLMTLRTALLTPRNDVRYKARILKICLIPVQTITPTRTPSISYITSQYQCSTALLFRRGCRRCG